MLFPVLQGRNLHPKDMLDPSYTVQTAQFSRSGTFPLPWVSLVSWNALTLTSIAPPLLRRELLLPEIRRAKRH